MHSSDTSGVRTPTLSAHIIVTVMTGNHYANNQKDPYVSTAHIPVELTLYGLARYKMPERGLAKRRGYRERRDNQPFGAYVREKRLSSRSG